MSKTDYSIVVHVITDGIIGHLNQLKGLVAALEQQISIDVHWIEVKSRWQALAVVGGSFARLPRPDWVLGAGSATQLAVVYAARRAHAKSIILMKPGIPMGLFDLCVVPRHDRVSPRPNVIETIGVLNRVIPSDTHDATQGLILIGGPCENYVWDRARIVDQIEQVLTRDGINWRIATSRRTDEALLTELGSRFASVPLIQPHEVDGNWLPEQLAKAGEVWASEDSVSMVFEALTSGAKVGLLRLEPKAHKRRCRIVTEMQRLVDDAWVQTLDSDPGAMAASDAPPLWEAERVAREIGKKFEVV